MKTKLQLTLAALVAVAILAAVVGLWSFALGAMLLALVLGLALFAHWALVPRAELPRNRVRHQRIRLYLYLHPGRGHATWWELHRQWGRRASYKRSAQVRSS